MVTVFLLVSLVSLAAFEYRQLAPRSVISLNPSTQAKPVPINADVLSTQGVDIHDLSNSKLLEIAHQAGFTWVRTDLLWSSVETSQGSYDFSGYLDFLANCHQYHLKVLFILDYSNQLYD